MATWKKIEDFDQSIDVFMSIQNNSLIPFSKVTVQFTTKPVPTEGQGFVLTGPNQWSQRVPAGTNVFYKEEDGGIATWWSRHIEKLVNYDIPTQEGVFANLTSKTIECPEGSFVTLQNISESPIFYNFLEKSNFVLTQYQAVSYTFAKDNVLHVKSDGTATLSYMIGQSPNVTMLSEETQKMLEEMNAKIDGLVENAATKKELDIVKKRTYFGKWSPFLAISGTKGKSITSPIFMKDEEYKSEFIKDKDIFDFALEINYTRHDKDLSNDKEEFASIRGSVIIQPEGEHHQFSSFYCDTPWFKRNIAGLDVYRDETNGQVRFEIRMKEEVKTFNLVASVRCDFVRFLATDKEDFLNEKISKYDIDKDNTDIHFTDEEFYLGILESWELDPYGKKLKISSVSKRSDESDGRLVEFTNTQEINFKFTFVEHPDNANVTIELSSALAIQKILGVNFKTKDVSKPDNVYLDLIVMGDGRQIKTSQDGKDIFTLPMYKLTRFGFDLIGEPLRNLEADKYYVEIIHN